MSTDDGDKYDSREPDKGDATPFQADRQDGSVQGRQARNANRLRRRRQNAAATAVGPRAKNEFGDTFRADVAEQATGNFLITIGYPGSGKSTFHSHIFRMCEEIHHVEPLHASGQPPDTVDPVMEGRLNAWRRRHHTREQVDPTEAGEANIFEIAFRITPRTRPNMPLDLRVVEVSGEDLKGLDNSAAGESMAEIPQAIGTLLTDEKLNERNIIIAFMVDPDPESDPVEFLADGLLSYMNVHGPRRLRRTKFCIIVPKPQKILEALGEYKDQYPDLWARHPRKPTLEAYRSAKEVDGNITSFYLSVFKNSLVQRLKTISRKDRNGIYRRGNIMRTQFYIGEIEQQYVEEEGQDVPLEVLTTISYRDANTVLNYIYEGFTGKKIKPGIIDKFRGR